MITVACVWVKGPVPYSVDYVVRLERMARRYLRRPFRFVCLTNNPRSLFPSTIETIPIDWPIGKLPAHAVGYWAKVTLFDRRVFVQGRVLFLDLDVLVVANLDPIADYPASLALTADPGGVHGAIDRDRYGRRLVRRFNSSVMVWRAGVHADLFADWTPAVADEFSTDQDWIAERAPLAVGMPVEWFPRISQLTQNAAIAAQGTPMPATAKVVLTKKPKNHDAVNRWPWFEQAWGGW